MKKSWINRKISEKETILGKGKLIIFLLEIVFILIIGSILISASICIKKNKNISTSRTNGRPLQDKIILINSNGKNYIV